MPWFRYILDPNNKLLMTTYHDVHNAFYENIYTLFSQDIKMYGLAEVKPVIWRDLNRYYLGKCSRFYTKTFQIPALHWELSTCQI